MEFSLVPQFSCNWMKKSLVEPHCFQILCVWPQSTKLSLGRILTSKADLFGYNNNTKNKIAEILTLGNNALPSSMIGYQCDETVCFGDFM